MLDLVNPSNAEDKITWISSSPSVATVNSNGEVEAKDQPVITSITQID